MFRYTIVLIAGLGLAGCAMDGADPMGDGPHDDRRTTRDGAGTLGSGETIRGDQIDRNGQDGYRHHTPGPYADDATLPIAERRTGFRQDVDRTLTDLDGWLEKRTADAGDLVDEGSAEVERELKALREEIARLGDATDAEWEKAKDNLRERVDKLQRRVDELGEPG